jgi:predicted phage terminase large subunit-like protein
MLPQSVEGFPPDELIDYALAEQSLEDFIELGWRYIDPADYIGNWHIGAIAEHLEAVASGQCRHLIIMMPPRHMKSLSVSVAFPAWVWAQKKRSALTGPGVGFLSTSYAQGLSVRDNLKCRRLIDSPWYQRGWGDRFQLTSDQNTKIRFENNRGGYRIASSVEGTATGDGGDIIIIDDAISAKDALSPTVRAAANEWFDGTMSTRLNDPKTGAYIIVMQRLHEGDLVGHVLEQAKQEGGDEWTVLCLPARYEREHPFVYKKDPRKKDGELLWPARMGEKQVRALEVKLGQYGTSGQLQQRPAPKSGGMFERANFEIVAAAPGDLEEVAAWDLAATVPGPGQDPDWTVRVRMGRQRSTGFFYIMDVLRLQGSPAKVETSIKNMAGQDGRKCRIRIPQDPGQAGKAQAAAFVRMLAGYAVKAVQPTGSKEARATPLSAQVEAGNVKLVKGDWNEPFLQEIELFPFGKHDDQVDAAADAFNELAEGSKGGAWLATLDAHLANKAAEAASVGVEQPSEPEPKPEPEGLARYVHYIRNTGIIPLPCGTFDVDWEPAGPLIRKQLVAAGLVDERDGWLHITAAEGAPS